MNEYPTLEDDQVREFIGLLAHRDATDDSVRTFLSDTATSSLGAGASKIHDVVERVVAACGDRTDKSLEPVEAQFCGEVFLVLNDLDDRALGDHRFWSYLAVAHFWPFVQLRQYSAWNAASGEPRNPDEPESERQKLERYLIGKDHYQLPLRMYLRGQAIRDGNDFSLAEINGGGTDFWRSQVLAVRTACYPRLARAIAEAQAQAQLDIDHQRPAGRRVNRLRTNIEFFLHDQLEAHEAVRQVWRTTPEDEDALEGKKAGRKARALTRKTTAKKKAAVKKSVAKQPTTTLSRASKPAAGKA